MNDTPGNVYSEIIVGPPGSGANVVGTTGQCIQIAIDALALRGGGLVRVLPGEYVLDASIRLRPHITLCGDRARTLLRRGPLVWSPLALDADISQTEITPERPEGFRPGMSVCTWDNASGWAAVFLNYAITRIAGGVLHLHDYMVDDRRAECQGRVVNFFPMVLGVKADGAVLEGFTIDAAVTDPDGVLAGMRTAVVHFWRSPGVVVRNCTIRNGRGDGLCFSKSSINALAEDCEVHDNDFYAIHPGSHSAGAKVRRCDMHHNGADGLYICWGIRGGEFVDNHIHHNGTRLFRSGICTGHKDTDNLIARNHIHDNKKYGIAFRRKTLGNAAHRTIVRDNLIENNGARADEFLDIRRQIDAAEAIGAGIHISGMTRDVVLENNTIRETRSGAERTQKHAVILAAGVAGTRMKGNTFAGHPENAVVDLSGETNQLQA